MRVACCLTAVMKVGLGMQVPAEAVPCHACDAQDVAPAVAGREIFLAEVKVLPDQSRGFPDFQARRVPWTLDGGSNVQSDCPLVELEQTQ